MISTLLQILALHDSPRYTSNCGFCHMQVWTFESIPSTPYPLFRWGFSDSCPRSHRRWMDGLLSLSLSPISWRRVLVRTLRRISIELASRESHCATEGFVVFSSVDFNDCYFRKRILISEISDQYNLVPVVSCECDIRQRMLENLFLLHAT